MIVNYLVGGWATPLKNDGVRQLSQLGWFKRHSQHMESHKIPWFQSPPGNHVRDLWHSLEDSGAEPGDGKEEPNQQPCAMCHVRSIKIGQQWEPKYGLCFLRFGLLHCILIALFEYWIVLYKLHQIISVTTEISLNCVERSLKPWIFSTILGPYRYCVSCPRIEPVPAPLKHPTTPPSRAPCTRLPVQKWIGMDRHGLISISFGILG